MDDQMPRMPERGPVTLRVARASKVIGMPVTQAQCVERDAAPRPGSREGDRARSTSTPPPWRFDLPIEEDLIEEVIRVIGYDELPAAPPLGTGARRACASEAARSAQRCAMRWPSSATRKRSTSASSRSAGSASWPATPTRSACSTRSRSRCAVMRSSLIGSLVDVLRHNLARKASRVRVFEIGQRLPARPGVACRRARVAGMEQPMRVGGLAYGTAEAAAMGRARARVDFYDVKGDLEALLAPRGARFVAGGAPGAASRAARA